MPADEKGAEYVPANGLVYRTNSLLIHPTVKQWGYMKWIAAILLVTSVSFLWERFLKELFDGFEPS